MNWVVYILNNVIGLKKRVKNQFSIYFNGVIEKSVILYRLLIIIDLNIIYKRKTLV